MGPMDTIYMFTALFFAGKPDAFLLIWIAFYRMTEMEMSKLQQINACHIAFLAVKRISIKVMQVM